jgi:DNA-binding winged helix-turn-helix (wHTH) protein
MSEAQEHSYEFGPFALHPGTRVLMREGEVVALAPKAIDLLVALVESSGRVVSKDELIPIASSRRRTFRTTYTR